MWPCSGIVVVSRRTIQGVGWTLLKQHGREKRRIRYCPIWLDGFDGPVCQRVWSGVDAATFCALAPGCRGGGPASA